ncbi:1,2-phenylacetyl-CoA epoxidase subunit PaaD [Fluviicola taffensis]|uniref:1,2-phenylacetyl-CoA epoxidase subunit PaaD n=1 Tax=Fluviicola taffensis TaxID=191579 RepID=UPI003137F4F4
MVSSSTTEHILELLRQVPDPEIPTINLVELGVVRRVEEVNGQLKVIITPTYTGCPAKQLFVDLIREQLTASGYPDVAIEMQLYPVWSTDWLSEETKTKLLKTGISPPVAQNAPVVCPHCGSKETKVVSQFGATPCQALYTCSSCREPFSYFKCH